MTAPQTTVDDGKTHQKNIGIPYLHLGSYTIYSSATTLHPTSAIDVWLKPALRSDPILLRFYKRWRAGGFKPVAVLQGRSF